MMVLIQESLGACNTMSALHLSMSKFMRSIPSLISKTVSIKAISAWRERKLKDVLGGEAMGSDSIIPKLKLSFWDCTLQHSALRVCESGEQETEADTFYQYHKLPMVCLHVLWAWILQGTGWNILPRSSLKRNLLLDVQPSGWVWHPTVFQRKAARKE